MARFFRRRHCSPLPAEGASSPHYHYLDTPPAYTPDTATIVHTRATVTFATHTLRS